MDKKGFTLVELLIVIGILAVLAAAVVVVLNPAELLAQARDSQRMQDLASVHSALSLYSVSTTSPTFGADLIITNDAGTCGVEIAADSDRTTDGNGWVRVNLDSLTGGSPLAVLPIDPVNSGDYAYCYDGDNTNKKWEVATTLESAKFVNGGGDDRESTDGGDNADGYEIGTDLTII